MHPTKWPSLASVWVSRHSLGGGLHDAKNPFITLQNLKALKSLKSQVQTLREIQTLKRPLLYWPYGINPDSIFYDPKDEQRMIRLDKTLGLVPGVGTYDAHWLRLPSTAPPHFEPTTPHGAHQPWDKESKVAGISVGIMLLMVTSLLLLFFIDNATKKIISLRRRQSVEWPTPNVLATTQQRSVDRSNNVPPRCSCEDRGGSPPPYSDCVQPGPQGNNTQPVAFVEPPPPYSACCVAFANPKEGIPSVHFYNGQGQSVVEEAQSSASQPKGQNNLNKSDGCDNVTVSAVIPSREGRDDRIIIDSGIPLTSGMNREASHIVNIG